VVYKPHPMHKMNLLPSMLIYAVHGINFKSCLEEIISVFKHAPESTLTCWFGGYHVLSPFLLGVVDTDCHIEFVSISG